MHHLHLLALHRPDRSLQGGGLSCCKALSFITIIIIFIITITIIVIISILIFLITFIIILTFVYIYIPIASTDYCDALSADPTIPFFNTNLAKGLSGLRLL